MECSWLIHIPFRPSILLKQHKIQLLVSSLWRYRRHDIMASHVTGKPESTAERFLRFPRKHQDVCSEFYLFGENFTLSAQEKNLWGTLQRAQRLLLPLCADGQKIPQHRIILGLKAPKLGHKNAGSGDLYNYREIQGYIEMDSFAGGRDN